MPCAHVQIRSSVVVASDPEGDLVAMAEDGDADPDRRGDRYDLGKDLDKGPPEAVQGLTGSGHVGGDRHDGALRKPQRPGAQGEPGVRRCRNRAIPRATRGGGLVRTRCEAATSLPGSPDGSVGSEQVGAGT